MLQVPICLHPAAFLDQLVPYQRNHFHQNRREWQLVIDVISQSILQSACRIDGRQRSEQNWIERANLEGYRLVFANNTFVSSCTWARTNGSDEVIYRHVTASSTVLVVAGIVNSGASLTGSTTIVTLLTVELTFGASLRPLSVMVTVTTRF